MGFHGRLWNDGEASSGLQGKGLTDKREEAGGHRKMRGLLAEELGDREQGSWDISLACWEITWTLNLAEPRFKS